MNIDFSGRGAIALLELLVSMHLLPAMVVSGIQLLSPF